MVHLNISIVFYPSLVFQPGKQEPHTGGGQFGGQDNEATKKVKEPLKKGQDKPTEKQKTKQDKKEKQEQADKPKQNRGRKR